MEKIIEILISQIDDVFKDLVFAGIVHNVVLWHEDISEDDIFFKKNAKGEYDIYRKETKIVSGIKNPTILEKTIIAIKEEKYDIVKILMEYDKIVSGKHSTIRHLEKIAKNSNDSTRCSIMNAKIDKEKKELKKLFRIISDITNKRNHDSSKPGIHN